MTCQFLHKSSSVSVDTLGTALVIVFADNPTNIADMERFCFCVKQAVPSAGLTLPVELTVNGTTVPLLNKFANNVLGSDIVTNRVNKGWYGTDNDDHIITSSLPAGSNKCIISCF